MSELEASVMLVDLLAVFSLSAVNFTSAAVARFVSIKTFAVASVEAASCAAFAFVVASVEAAAIAAA